MNRELYRTKFHQVELVLSSSLFIFLFFLLMSKSSSSNVMDPSFRMRRASSTGTMPSVASSFTPTTDFEKSWISRVGNSNNAEKISLDRLFTEEFRVVGRVQSNFLYEGSSQFANNYRLVLYGEHA